MEPGAAASVPETTLSRKHSAVRCWVKERYGDLLLQYFGASTGSAAALKAVVTGDTRIGAVVSRGGRPDMVMEDLPQVTVPTLFIVGGKDVQVKEMNERAFEKLGGKKSFEVVPGAGHLFEEEGKLEQVAALPADWFVNNP